MKHLLGESLDSFGVPALVEGYDVEVEFDHQGRKAVALFEVGVASTPLPGNREFPAEEGEADVVLVDVWDKESDEDIDPASIDREALSDQAAEKFWDEIYPEIQRGKD